MTKTLDDVIEKARRLPSERQDQIAPTIAALIDDANSVIGAEHRAEIARRFAEPFDPADEAEVEAFFAKYDA